MLACAQLISDTAAVGIELFPEELAKFVNRDVIKLAESLGIAPFLFTLNAGYDWEVICTVPKSRQNALNALCQPSPLWLSACGCDRRGRTAPPLG